MDFQEWREFVSAITAGVFGGLIVAGWQLVYELFKNKALLERAVFSALTILVFYIGMILFLRWLFLKKEDKICKTITSKDKEILKNYQYFIKLSFFIFIFILAIVLYINRFGFTYTFWIDNPHYWVNNELRHILEHFSFGTLPAIILGMLYYFNLIKLDKIRCIYGIFIFVVLFVLFLGIKRTYDLNNCLQTTRFIYDIIGLFLSYKYIKELIKNKLW